MKRIDRIKLDFVRNWKLPGKERLSNWLQKSAGIKSALNEGIVWLSEEDIAIYTTADNFIELAVLSTGTYEAEIGKLIRTSLKQGNIALDIGANIGLQSIRMSQCCGEKGEVYAFEPLSYICKKFNKNITLNKCSNITLLQLAISDKDEISTITIDEHAWNQGAFSLQNTNNGGALEQITIKIADQIPEIINLSRLELIKIDVEGFEYHVLRGLELTLKKFKPRLIFEYDVNYWIATGQSITDCYKYLSAMDYTLYQVTQVGCELIRDAEMINDGNLYCLPL